MVAVALADRYFVQSYIWNLFVSKDLVKPKAIAYLLKYDSIHGRFPGIVEATEDSMIFI